MTAPVIIIQEATNPQPAKKEKEPRYTWKQLVAEVIGANYKSGDQFRRSELVTLVLPVAADKFPKNNNVGNQVGTNLTKLIYDGVVTRLEKGVYKVV
jgi:hypothetical protein